ncbi:MAG: VIT1/CCC1 transporter family protein [Candidatus Hermodarchaeota archaeon]|nr:VIT1/CCC1 transporter family protein [Candidatus Hermodarchaeota archaeon]
MERIERYRELAKVSRSGAITRRYFATNAFDGTLTIVGLVLGSYFALILNPMTIVRAGIGACIAMMFSGFAGTYFAERQIQRDQLQELEKAMLRKLDKTLPNRASNFVIITSAIVDGVAPLTTGLVCLIPIMATTLGIITLNLAVIISIIIGLITLFLLGFYIGKVARTNPWVLGLQTFFIGIGTAIAIIIIQITI